jgi:hypothetical protein
VDNQISSFAQESNGVLLPFIWDNEVVHDLGFTVLGAQIPAPRLKALSALAFSTQIDL